MEEEDKIPFLHLLLMDLSRNQGWHLKTVRSDSEWTWFLQIILWVNQIYFFILSELSF